MNYASLLAGAAAARNETPDRVVRDKITSTLASAAVRNQVLMHGEEGYRSRAQRQPIVAPGADDTVMIYPCSRCSERFVSIEDLGYHMRKRTHNGCPKPVTCAVCEKRFHSMSTLEIHGKTDHEGEEIFKCSKCGHGSKNKTTFGNHQRYWCQS